MKTRSRLHALLTHSGAAAGDSDDDGVMNYARYCASIENSVVVVSDMAREKSRIFCGAFAATLGIENYESEDSIWERLILDLLPEAEQEEKYRAELRFYHYLRHLPRHRRPCYRLVTQLRMAGVDVIHRMYYIYDGAGDTIKYAVCVYEPLVRPLPARSIVVDSTSGLYEVLESSSDTNILTKREIQVLGLIDGGSSSKEIADMLSISINTVSRHRQDILAKLRARNSTEACRAAKSLGIL